MQWKHKQHDRQTHTQSVRAPCPVICCNLELWQFTETSEQSWQHWLSAQEALRLPPRRGNIADALMTSSRSYKPTTCVLTRHSSGQHGDGRENAAVQQFSQTVLGGL